MGTAKRKPDPHAHLRDISALGVAARAQKRAERERAVDDAWPLRDKHGARRSIESPADCARVQAWTVDQLAANTITAAVAKQISMACNGFISAHNEQGMWQKIQERTLAEAKARGALAEEIKDLQRQLRVALDRATNAEHAWERLKAQQLTPKEA